MHYPYDAIGKKRDKDIQDIVDFKPNNAEYIDYFLILIIHK